MILKLPDTLEAPVKLRTKGNNPKLIFFPPFSFFYINVRTKAKKTTTTTFFVLISIL